MAVSIHAALLQTGPKCRDIGPASDCYSIQRLSVCPLDMLHHNVAVDEVGTDPQGVKGRPGVVQEDNTDDVVSNVSLLVDL